MPTLRFAGSDGSARTVIVESGRAVYVDSVNGDDNRTYTQAQNVGTPWRTLQKARDAVPNTEPVTVYVRAGTYTNFKVSATQTRTQMLTFKPYGNEVVTLAGLPDAGTVFTSRAVVVQNAARYRFEGFKITGGALVERSSFVEFVGNEITGNPAASQTALGLRFRESSDILVERNTMHYFRGGGSIVTTLGALGEAGMIRFTIRGNHIYDAEYDALAIYWKLTDVLIEDNYIHDITRAPGSTYHTDGIQIAPQGDGALRVTVRRNLLLRCFQGLFIKDGLQRELVVENNVSLERLSTPSACSIYNAPGARIVNNTFANLWLRATGYEPSTNLIMENNLVTGDITKFNDTTNATLTSWASDKNNMAASYSGFTPDPSDIVGSATFVNPAAGDYRLAASSKGLNAGAKTVYTPTMDRNGNPRPVGAAVDIGAYERQVGDP